MAIRKVFQDLGGEVESVNDRLNRNEQISADVLNQLIQSFYTAKITLMSLNRTVIDREGRRRLWGVPRNAITKTDIQRLDQRIIDGLNTINFRATTEQLPVTFSEPLLHLPIYIS
jgi:hypothetical protein